ncbi:MAG: hypothetical protein IPK87_01560 [Planctomycetes bacterium]|nr:hypothetical protein [Planctomycetota bacterium]
MRVCLLAFMLLCAGACAAQVETQLGKTGLRVATEDGAFEFNMTTAVQFRFTYHDVRAEGGNGGQNGADFNNFRNVGVRSFLTGHLFAPEFQYRVWLAWGGPGPGFRIEDCFFRWAPIALFNITVGQERVPASWEYLVDHERTGLSDRAVADEAFSQGWGKGVSISGRAELWEGAFDAALLTWQVGVYNGVLASADGSQGRGMITNRGVQVTDQGRTEHFVGGFRNSDVNVNAENFSQLVDGQMMVAARVEFHPMGEVARHMVDLGALEDTAAWFFMVGLAANWMSARVNGAGTFLDNIYYGEASPSGTPVPPPASGRERVDASIVHLTADGHFRWIGFSLNWALHFRRINFSSTGRLAEANLASDKALVHGAEDYGVTVDAAYFILRDVLMVGARFSLVEFDDFKSRQPITAAQVDGDAFGADSYEYGGGVTWFIKGDNLKLSLDYRVVTQQLPHGRSRSGALSATERISDWRNMHEVRVQLQWIF